MALKPIVGEIKAQVLNDNFSYVRQLAEEAGTDPELEQRVDALETELASHKAERVTDVNGVHGLKIDEGTWTPRLSGTEVLGEHTYTVQSGTYYKVGKIVYIFGRITLDVVDSSWAGTVQIRGIPYTSKSLSAIGLGGISNVKLISGSKGFTLYTGQESSVINIAEFGDDTPIKWSNVGQFKSGSSFYFSGVYEVLGG